MHENASTLPKRAASSVHVLFLTPQIRLVRCVCSARKAEQLERGSEGAGVAINLALGRFPGCTCHSHSCRQGAIARWTQPLEVDPKCHSRCGLVRIMGVRICTLAEGGRYERQFIGLAKIWQRPTFAAMTTMNISLPDALKTFVDEQVSGRGYGTSSEYVRELIRRDQDRQRLRGLLLDGAASPSAGPADQGYFDGLRERARGRKTG